MKDSDVPLPLALALFLVFGAAWLAMLPFTLLLGRGGPQGE